MTTLSQNLTKGTELVLTDGTLGTVERVTVGELVIVVDYRVNGRPTTAMFATGTELKTN